MSDELIVRARELLALRDRFDANPDDGRVSERFADAVPRAFDRIRDMLAEVERQANNADNSALEAADMRARAEAAEQREAVLSAAEVKIDGHRFACSQAVADHVARLDADRVAAEARLHELASAEPVRYEYEWFDPGLGRYDGNWGELRPRHGQTMEQKVAEIESYQRIDSSGQMYRVRALIPRPEMPS